MARGTVAVPLVAFPDDGNVRRSPELGETECAALDRAIMSLRRLHGCVSHATGRSGKLDEWIDRASNDLRQFAACLAPLGPTPEQLEAIPAWPHPEYFGLRRLELSPEQILAQAAVIFQRSLGDSRCVLLDVKDLAAEVEAILTALARIAAQCIAFAPGADCETGVPPSLYEPCGDGLERWIVAHHCYFLLNLHAAGAVREAVETPTVDAASILLNEAATYVRGFTAAMAHSAAFSAPFYRDSVRSGMSPPAVPAPLTGRMQAEHSLYRTAVTELLKAYPEPFAELVKRRPALALARDELLEADLLDIERHILVAAGLVGNDRSLIQREQAQDNAVSTLRSMRHARAARYCSLMRHGDRTIAQESAASRR